jgi:hypothetical protein
VYRIINKLLKDLGKRSYRSITGGDKFISIFVYWFDNKKNNLSGKTTENRDLVQIYVKEEMIK